MMKRLFLVAGISAIVARPVAANSDLPVVDLGYERHRALSLDEVTGLYNFSNIRYAQNPVGPLRFRAPERPAGRVPDIQTGEQARICPQSGPEWTLVSAQFSKAVADGREESFNMTEAARIARQQIDEGRLPSPRADENPNATEDCLVLDVVVPSVVFRGREIQHRAQPSNGAPVVVWIHGGGYVRGNKLWENSGDPSQLITTSQEDGSDGIVYVGVGYRLGALGWLAGSALQDAGGASNAGLLDQRLALEWVRENIHLFGGDPDQVTVMGQSAGGGSVIHHITSYGGSEPVPFRRAISLSPAWVPLPLNQLQENTTNIFLEYLNVTTIEEARSASSEDVIRANALAIRAAPWSTFRYGPVVDGIYVPDHPSILLDKGDFDINVTVMTGRVLDESSLFTPPFIKSNKNLTDFLYYLYPTAEEWAVDYIVDTIYPDPGINRTMQILSDVGFTCNVDYLRKAFHGQTYNYNFRIPPAVHGDDLAYLFYNGPSPEDVDGGVYNGPLGPAVADVALVYQQYVANFIKYGDPNGSGLHPFPRADEDTTMLTFDVNGVGVAPDDTDNERCDWLQGVPYA